MKLHKWQDIKDSRLSPERQAEIQRGVDAEVGGPVNGTSENDCQCFHTKAHAVDSYGALWDNINDPKREGLLGCWDSSPWVWALSFSVEVRR